MMSRRLILHTISATLTWGLFAYYWWLVSLRRVTPETVRSLQVLSTLVGLVWLITSLWIHRNQRRFGRGPDRRQRRQSVTALPLTDTLGVPIDVGGDVTLNRAVYVELSLDPGSGRKRFDAYDSAPQREELEQRQGGAA